MNKKPAREYLCWKEEIITDFSEANVAKKYNEGFVFTRIGKGVMQQTRSVRIDMSRFELTSENRRILKKTEGVELKGFELPLKDYDFKVGKLAKDFYDEKFGPGIMSANKVKELVADLTKSSFNSLLTYSNGDSPLGYTICYQNKDLLHYSYPFYDLDESPKDMGLGMMIRAVQYAKEAGLKYIYLGSLQRPGDIYKLQFEGLEWFDRNGWQTGTAELKEILK
ncbi:MAG: GNAT family N-acetyltransferase [Candidatus Paceibacterota bacterium]